jgi:cyclic pyranopterin phosphate synthase
MPEGSELDYVLSPDLLSRQEITTLVEQVFIPLGFRRFRLTGGEPLLRPDLVELVQDLAHLPGVEDLALTTNGFLLHDRARDLYEAGLRRLNISLDSLDAQTFHRLIGHNGTSRWETVWQGIQTAHQLGFSPLKLNVVVIPGVNDREVIDLAALTLTQDWQVRFIEFMPIGNGDWFSEKGWIPSAHLRQQLVDTWGDLIPLTPGQVKGAGPAEVYKIPGARGSVGFISQMSECFCDRCNRIRLSADGWLRPCLLNETGQVDLKTPLRSSQDPQILATLQAQVRSLLHLKPEINFKQRDSGTDSGHYQRTMSQIGG